MQCLMKSWIQVAAESHFPIQNIPFGIFSLPNDPRRRGGTAIGDFVLDLDIIYNAGLLNDTGLTSNVFAQSSLNAFMEHPKSVWTATRSKLIDLLSDGDNADSRLRSNEELQKQALLPMGEVVMHLPAQITEYTDFYSSRYAFKLFDPFITRCLHLQQLH
jgi:fumarylacetoacetase